MDKNDWSPLLQLALGDATMLKELLREPIAEEKPEPGEEIVPAMAQALADWAALLPGDVVTLGGDPTYPMPPVLRSGDGWLDFYELTGGEEAERVDTLAGISPLCRRASAGGPCGVPAGGGEAEAGRQNADFSE